MAIVSEDTITPVRPIIACKQAKLGLDSLLSVLLNYSLDDVLGDFLCRCYDVNYLFFISFLYFEFYPAFLTA